VAQDLEQSTLHNLMKFTNKKIQHLMNIIIQNNEKFYSLNVVNNCESEFYVDLQC